jgi:hypothetical protein
MAKEKEEETTLPAAPEGMIALPAPAGLEGHIFVPDPDGWLGPQAMMGYWRRQKTAVSNTEFIQSVSRAHLFLYAVAGMCEFHLAHKGKTIVIDNETMLAVNGYPSQVAEVIFDALNDLITEANGQKN